MSKLGQIFKEEREKRNLSLQEVGLTLKISTKVLKAIEEGNQKDFPAPTFLRGFIKSYSLYLKLDPKVMLDQFSSEYGSPQKDSHSTETDPAQINTSRTGTPVSLEKTSRRSNEELSAANSRTNKSFSIIAAGILLVAIAIVAKLMDKYKNEANTEPQTELIASLSTTTTTLPENQTASTTSGDSSLSAEEISGTTSSPGTTESVVSSGTKQNQTPTTTLIPSNSSPSIAPQSTSTTTLNKITTTSTTLKSTTSASSTTTTTMKTTTSPQGTASTISSSMVPSTTVPPVITEVIIEALNQVKIRFTLNGGVKWETVELTADQVHTFRSKSGVTMEISDGGAINIILNGKDRGVPGTIGRPLKLTYPK